MGVENLAFITCCQARKFKLPLRKKCQNTEFFLVRILFSPNAEKYGPEKLSIGHFSRSVLLSYWYFRY